MNLKVLTLIGAVGLMMAGNPLVADDTAVPGDPNTPPTPVVDPPKQDPPQTPPDDVKPPRPTSPTIVRPDRPTRPDKPELPAEIKQLIDEFQKARESFLADQRDLAKQIRGATADERETLREQLKANREEWLDKQKELREEIKAAIQRLKETLPSHKDLIDQAKEKANDHKRGR
jgi:hypothetical protein